MSKDSQNYQVKYQDVLKFWFEELKPADWFKKSPDLDERIRSRFQGTLERALRGELYTWRAEPLGRLAEIIVLDQLSRNIFRDQGQAFAGDPIALTLAQECVLLEIDKKIPDEKVIFIYMPYMHSESPVIHEQAVELFSKPGLESNLQYEMRHKKIIDRFGRFPHRNALLGRSSTPEEIEFLKQPNSSF